MSCASIPRDLKRRVNPDELGVTVQGIRETRSKGLLVELKVPKEGRRWLNSTFQEAIGVSGTVRHLVPRIEVEITDLERRSLESITSRVQRVVRVSVRQPRKGDLGEAAIKNQAGRLGGRRSSAYCAYRQGSEV